MARKRKELIALSEITIDPQYRVRSRLYEPTIELFQELYTDDPDQLPPIAAIREGTKIIIVAGFHRLEGAKRAGLKEIWCTILDGDEKVGLWHAIGSHKHGRPITLGDLKNVVLLALDSFPDKKPVEIAKQVGCPVKYVRKIRDERRDRKIRAIFSEKRGVFRDMFWKTYFSPSDEKIRQYCRDIQVLFDIEDDDD